MGLRIPAGDWLKFTGLSINSANDPITFAVTGYIPDDATLDSNLDQILMAGPRYSGINVDGMFVQFQKRQPNVDPPYGGNLGNFDTFNVAIGEAFGVGFANQGSRFFAFSSHDGASSGNANGGVLIWDGDSWSGDVSWSFNTGTGDCNHGAYDVLNFQQRDAEDWTVDEPIVFVEAACFNVHLSNDELDVFGRSWRSLRGAPWAHSAYIYFRGDGDYVVSGPAFASGYSIGGTDTAIASAEDRIGLVQPVTVSVAWTPTATGSASLGDYAENKVLDAFTGKASWNPSPYLAYSTASAGEDGSGLSEPSGNNYSRTAIA